VRPGLPPIPHAASPPSTGGSIASTVRPSVRSNLRGDRLRRRSQPGKRLATHSLKVCLVAPMPPPYGGIAHWTQLIVRHAAQRRDVKLYIVDTAQRLRAVHDTARWKRILLGGTQAVREIARLAFLLVRERLDSVHLTTSGGLGLIRDLLVMFTARIALTPVVYHIRFGRVPSISRANTFEWRVMRMVLAMAHTVVALDSATENALRRHDPRARVTCIPNCTDQGDLSPSADAPRETRTALFLGWVIKTKGIEELLDAWARLRPREWRLLIVGPGDESYRRRIIQSHGADGVEFTGEMQHAEAMQLLRRADVFVLPSYTEGFPNSVLEAMMMGKAIVATDVGAIPAMLSDGCGLTVPPRDVKRLGAAMAAVLGDSALRQALGARARARASAESSIDTVFARYLALWRSVTNKATTDGS
jgi:glycosyltransferase involved in cell wall biosynthesis